MRVLWLSVTPSMFQEGKVAGWIASLENQMHVYYRDQVDLAVVFETSDHLERKIVKGNTTYYPVKRNTSLAYRLMTKTSVLPYWEHLRKHLVYAIQDFAPDIIHCFGSEWPFAMIAAEIDIPVVIHMQGFMNIYHYSNDVAISTWKLLQLSLASPSKCIRLLLQKKYAESQDVFERELMKQNRYFMGRTEWDRNIVKYYSPGSRYYHVEEAIRPDIYYASKTWAYSRKKRICLVTITQASFLKGNEMILQTAKILKELIGIDFEWRVAGNKEAFSVFEKKTGIKASDVNVLLLGMIDVQKIIDELSGAAFYVHPAIMDNSPNSLCEAQLMGCPVIAANVGGISQLVEDGKTGFLYPYNEPHTLAFTICNLADDEAKLTEVSKAEIEASHRRHDPRTVTETVYKTYKAIIADYQNPK